MKRIIFLLPVLLILLLALGSGCSGDSREPDQEPAGEPVSGVIYRIEEGRVLVVDNIDDVNMPWNQWFEQGRRAVFFGVDDETVVEVNNEIAGPEILARGQKVAVYHEGFLAESYPEQGKALKIVILDDTYAEEERIESGRFMGLSDEGLLEIKISGVPDEMPARQYALTSAAAAELDKLELETEEVIMIRFISDQASEGLVFDITRLEN